MIKRNVKLSTALVLLIVGAASFYACQKETSTVDDILNNLTKEAEFVSRIHEKLCVHVDVFRDENNNVHIMTKETDNTPEVRMNIIIPNTLNVNYQTAKNGDEEVFIELPDDAIHWLVPLDGNEPIKIEPDASDAKQSIGGGLTGSCSCTQGKPNCWVDLTCPAPVTHTDAYGTYLSCPAPTGCCQNCNLKASNAKNTLSMGSSYIVQSNTITINGIVYE